MSNGPLTMVGSSSLTSRHDIHVAQPKGLDDRLCPLHGRLTDVDAEDLPARTDDVRQHGKRPNRTAPALDGPPTRLDPDALERGAAMRGHQFSNTQQTAQIGVASVEDVALDPVRDSIGQAVILFEFPPPESATPLGQIGLMSRRRCRECRRTSGLL
jgi:hypothetical protein